MININLPTRDQLIDAADATLASSRADGRPDWETRVSFCAAMADAAGEAFDLAADPTGEFAPPRGDAQP